MTMMESKTYVQVQCPDCKNFYKNRNTLNSHRSGGSCVGRKSLQMRKVQENIIIKEEPRPPTPLRTVNRQSMSPRKVQSPERRPSTKSTQSVLPISKHSKPFSVIRGKRIDAEFNEDDQAYWREFEQSQQQ